MVFFLGGVAAGTSGVACDVSDDNAGSGVRLFFKATETGRADDFAWGFGGYYDRRKFFFAASARDRGGRGASRLSSCGGGFLLGGMFIIVSDLLLSRTQRTFHAIGDKRTALLYFAVTLHNIPEGMAVGVAFAAGMSGEGALAGMLLAVGIAVQNFPEGMCVAFPMRAKGMSPMKSFLFAQGSGAVEVPACVLGAIAAAAIGSLLPWALAFSAGAMVAVVCSELIPECFSGNKTLASVGVVAGFCLMMVLDVALG